MVLDHGLHWRALNLKGIFIKLSINQNKGKKLEYEENEMVWMTIRARNFIQAFKKVSRKKNQVIIF